MLALLLGSCTGQLLYTPVQDNRWIFSIHHHGLFEININVVPVGIKSQTSAFLRLAGAGA